MSSTPVPTGPNQVLASSKTAAVRRPTYENPIYAERNESGLYDAVAKQILDMGMEALANLDYPDTITRRIEEWSGHQSFLDTKGSELVAAVVGEVLGPVAGTLIRAQGTHYAGNADTFTPVDDKTKIKDTIAIGIPTAATTRLHNTCLNQCIVASQIVAANTDEDKHKDFYPTVKNWTKSLADKEQHDIMILTMLPKYGVPSPAGAPKVKRVSKRALDEVDDIENPVPKDDGPPVEPTGDEIKLGAFYEPSLLPDFGGDYFDLEKAKLVQLDVRDKESNLIPPWKLYDALKPGTLILALVSLHVYLMTDTRGKERKVRRVYQLNAESIRVLAESNEPVEERTRPIPPTSSGRGRADLPARAVPTSFANFVVPGMQAASKPISEVDEVVTPSTPKSSSAGSSATLDDAMEVDDVAKAPRKRVKKN